MDNLTKLLVVFFGVINPLMTLVTFPSLTRGMNRGTQAATALLATVVAFGIVVVFAVAGDDVLRFLDVSLPSFRIAGGLVLGLAAVHLIQHGEPTPPSGEAAKAPTDVLVPLATPLIAGPATITATVAYAHVYNDLETIVAGAIILLITLAVMLASGWLSNRIPRSALSVAARLMGLLLLALAFDLAADGIKAHFMP
ncbi:MAG TPA: MarC family protein [bacterium]|jgi:multiple antibiotic resistance protein|nr:MarC family protein [bacterium]